MPPTTESVKRSNAKRIIPPTFNPLIDELGELRELIYRLQLDYRSLFDTIKTNGTTRQFGFIWCIEKEGKGMRLMRMADGYTPNDGVQRQKEYNRRSHEKQNAQYRALGVRD